MCLNVQVVHALHRPHTRPVSFAVPVKEIDDIGVLHLFHDQDLVDDELLLRLLLQVNLFDGHLHTDTDTHFVLSIFLLLTSA